MGKYRKNNTGLWALFISLLVLVLGFLGFQFMDGVGGKRLVGSIGPIEPAQSQTKEQYEAEARAAEANSRAAIAQAAAAKAMSTNSLISSLFSTGAGAFNTFYSGKS